MVGTEVRDRLHRGLQDGRMVTFGPDLDLAEPFPSDRRIDADVLIDLVAKKDEDPALGPLKIRGAEVVDELDFEYRRIATALVFEHCRLPRIVLEQAQAIDLWFIDCRIEELSAVELSTRYGLVLQRCVVPGGLSLMRAEIHGRLGLDGTQVSGYLDVEEAAFSCNGIRVDGPALLRTSRDPSSGVFQPFRVQGPSDFMAGRFGSELDMGGAQFVNPEGPALDASEIRVEGNMRCTCFWEEGMPDYLPFTCDGKVILTGAQVKGDLDFRGATVAGIDAERLNVGGLQCRTEGDTVSFVATGDVSLLESRVIGRMDVAGATFRGALDLRDAHVSRLEDVGASWPDRILLDGFTYERLPGLTTPGSVGSRLAWLKKAELYAGYRPRVYNQLATVYRNAGMDDATRQVLLEKQRARTRARVRGTSAGTQLQGAPPDGTPTPKIPRGVRAAGLRAWDLFLTYTIGYGYRPQRILYWLAGGLLVATIAFSLLHPDHVALARTSGNQPDFSAFLFSLDLLLPVATLGQRTAFVTMGPAAWFSAFFTVYGWLLGAVLVTGLTGFFKRD